MFILDSSTFSNRNVESIVEFVTCWERFHTDDGQLYLRELNLTNDLTDSNVIALLRWKDPRWLTHPLKKDRQPNPRVQKVLRETPSINSFRNGHISADEFQEVTARVFPNGIIWQLFLFHISRPADWPIADQHVFRAYSRLFGAPTPNSFNSYRQYVASFNLLATPFINSLTLDRSDLPSLVKSQKRLDNALLSYGQFLAKYDCEQNAEPALPITLV